MYVGCPLWPRQVLLESRGRAVRLMLTYGSQPLRDFIFPGWLTLWMAVLADMGATLLVTLNALRLLRIAPKSGDQLE